MSESVTYQSQELLVEKQNHRQREIMAQFKAGGYGFENPLVVVNPYLVCPLTALVLFTTEREEAITVSVIGKEPEGTISHTFPKGKTHILPILGLYPDCENTVEIGYYQGPRRRFTVTTEKLENAADVLKIDTTPEYMAGNLMFVTPVISGLATGFDYRGDIRWHLTIPTIFDFSRVQNGNIITGSHRLMQSPYFVSGLYEMDMLGKIHTEYRVPGGYHHDHIEMADGNLLVLSDDLLSDTVEDIAHLVDRKTGAVLKTWDYKTEIKPEEAPPSINYSLHDWFHANALAYDDKTDTLTLSGRHSDAIINIEYASGKLNWIIGDPERWPNRLQKYFFKPEGDDFGWQYEQHAVVLTPDGDVMCFDNGHGRSKIPEKRVKNRDNYSRAVRYRINTVDMTIRQIWQYGKERGAEFFSQYICNLDYYGEGHYMVHSGGVGYHDGQPAEFMVAFEPNDPKNEQRSITVEVLHDKPVFEMQLKGNFYRARKMKLYHDGENTSAAEGRVVGKMQPTKQAPAAPSATTAERVPAHLACTVTEEPDRIVFKGRFEQGQKAFLCLEKSGDARAYAIPTGKLDGTCAGSFLKKKNDPSNTWVTVNKEGLSGKYELSLSVDGKRYSMGMNITM